MVKHIQKTLIYIFSNSFTKQEILRVSMPYLPFKSTTGHYSKYYKVVKDAAATGAEKSLIVGKHLFENRKTDRIVFEWPNKVRMDIPHDVTKKGCDIILYHLEGFKMAARH